jgi:hypothetical protein
LGISAGTRDEGLQIMTTDLDTTRPEEPKCNWFGTGKFLFVIVLVVLFFLLGHNMVRHRFFRGGWSTHRGFILP